MRDRNRTVVLFGKVYVWKTEGGRLVLRPDYKGYTLFPRTTARLIRAV